MASLSSHAHLGKEHVMKRIAVITTSMAQPRWTSWPQEKKDKHGMGSKTVQDPEPCYEVSPFFQELVDQGYEIVVYSSRYQSDIPGPLDAGWLPHVHPSRIFALEPAGPCEKHTGGCHCHWHTDTVLRVYKHLGLEAPVSGSGSAMDLIRYLRSFGIVMYPHDLEKALGIELPC